MKETREEMRFNQDDIELIIESLEIRINGGTVSDDKQEHIIELLKRLKQG